MKNLRILNSINAVYFAALIVMSYRLVYGINDFWDVIGADEISYLKFGKNLFHEVHFDWGFTYNLWYKGLSFCNPRTIDLYYLNYKVLITAIPILLFICLLVYNIHSSIAFAISFLYLISKLHITTWPFVSDFCIVLLLSYFIILRYINDKGWKTIFLTLMCLLLYLTRPEYIVSFLMAICYSFYMNREHKKRWTILFLMLLVLIYIGNKTTKTFGIDRAFFAYAQHYAITYKIWHKNNALDIYSYIRLAPKIFGSSFTLVGSILYNPLEAVRHIVTCIGFYFITFLKNAEDLLLPSIWFQSLGKLKHLLFIAILVLVMLYYMKNKTFDKLKNDHVLLFSFLFFFIAGAIPNFLIGYAPHYFQLHFILYIVFISLLLFKDIGFRSKTRLPVVMSGLFIITMPTLKNYVFGEADISECKNLPIQKMAVMVNKINDGQCHCLLAYQTNIQYVFEGNNFKGFDVFSINKPFIQFIKENKVDCIYINRQFLKDERLRDDSEWKSFIANPEKFAFVKKEITGTKNYLLTTIK